MDNFNFSFPINMVKKEQRIISGIATADNIDKSNDLVDFAASEIAFKNWQGNIREMHAPIAVGKAISYKPIKMKDAEGKEYNAIEVAAYISKGAESTWQKILDGTLRAFSIGGKIMKKEILAGKLHNNRPINVIKEYELGELSLVDNPANVLAVIDLVKMDTDGRLDYVLMSDVAKADKPRLKDSKGDLTVNKLQNDVNYDIVKPMENSLTDNKLSLIKKFINWLAPEDNLGLLKSDDGAETSSEVEVVVAQVEEQEMDIEVLKEALGSVIDQKLTDFATSFKQEVEANVNAKIEEVAKSVETQKVELAEKLEATEIALEVQTAKVEEFAQAGAVKKSVDPEEEEEVQLIQSAPVSFWGNMYLPQGLIKSLGYKS